MNILSIITPIFLIITLGYCLKKAKIVKPELSDYLMQYVFYIAAPCVIFSTISRYNLLKLNISKFWIAYPISISLSIIAVYLLSRFILKNSRTSALNYAYASSIKNVLAVGFPVLSLILGNKVAVPMAIVIIIFNCFFTPILIFSYKKQRDEKITMDAILGTLINPLVFASLLGFLFAALQIKIPSILSSAFNYINSSFIACALIAVGIDMCWTSVRKNMGVILLISAFSTILSPLIAIIVSKLLNLPPFYAVCLVVFSSLPTAKTIYLYAKQYNINPVETSAILTMTTVLNILTLPLFIYLSKILWVTAFH